MGANVQKYAVMEFIETITFASFLHDLSKIGILVSSVNYIVWRKRCHVEKVKSVLVEFAENGSYQILGLGIGRKPAVIVSVIPWCSV